MKISKRIVASLVLAMIATIVVGVMAISKLEKDAAAWRQTQHQSQVVYGTRIGPMGQEMLVLK